MDEDNKSLEHVPPTISVGMLPKSVSITQRCLEKARTFQMESYIHQVTIKKNSKQLTMAGSCYRSMKKNEPAYRMSVELDLSIGVITNADCTCKAGYMSK